MRAWPAAKRYRQCPQCHTKREADEQKAREQAALAYLRRRVEMQEALPLAEMVGEAGRADEEEEEREAVYEFIVRHTKGGLCVALAKGVRLR